MKQTHAEKRHEALLVKPPLARLVKRSGLSESLEEYAARLGLDRGAARLQWRAFGVQLLGLGAGLPVATIMRQLAPYELDSCIMPGLRVPTKNGRGIEDRS